jgi:hypothetical protein
MNHTPRFQITERTGSAVVNFNDARRVTHECNVNRRVCIIGACKINRATVRKSDAIKPVHPSRTSVVREH